MWMSSHFDLILNCVFSQRLPRPINNHRLINQIHNYQKTIHDKFMGHQEDSFWISSELTWVALPIKMITSFGASPGCAAVNKLKSSCHESWLHGKSIGLRNAQAFWFWFWTSLKRTTKSCTPGEGHLVTNTCTQNVLGKNHCVQNTLMHFDQRRIKWTCNVRTVHPSAYSASLHR